MLSRYAMPIAGALVLGLLLAGCGDEKKAEPFIAKAIAERASGDLPAAALDLRNALRIDGKNKPARLMLAQIALDMSDPATAEAAALRAQQEGASDLETIRLLTKAQLLGGHYEEILHNTSTPPAGATAEVTASLQAFRARALAGLDHFVAAHETLDLGMSRNPRSLDLLIAAVRIAMLEGDIVTARRHLVDAVLIAPADLELAQITGDIAYSVGQYGEAMQAYQAILDARPWSIVAGADLARAEIAAKRDADAIALLDHLLSVEPERPELIYLRGLAAFQERDFPRALTQAAAVLARAREFYIAQVIGGAASYATGEYDSAKNFIASYVNIFPNDALARQLLATIETALEDAQTGKPTTPNAALLASIGAAALREGDPTTANRFIADKAGDQVAPGIAALQSAARDPIAELEQAVKSEPGALGARASLYFAYMHAKSFDKALAVAAELDRMKPNDPIVADLAGVAHLAQGDIKAGRAQLQRALALRPSDFDANNNLAQLALAEGKPDDARRIYRGLLRDNPHNLRAAIALGELEDASGHGDAAEALLQQAVKSNPNDVVAHAALAKFQLAKSKFQAVIDQAQPLLGKYPHSPILLEAVGRAYLATGQFGAALAAFKKLVAEQTWDGSAHLSLADAYAAEGLWSGVVSEAGQALKLSPGDNGAKFALARGLFADGRLTEARSLVDALKAAEPGNPAMSELDGMIARAQGRKQDAVAAFKAVLSVYDTSVDRLLLAQAQLASGKADDAAATLVAWLEAHPGDFALRKQLGDLYLAVERLEPAIEQYGLVVKGDAKNAAALNNLAWALAQAGRVKDAVPLARRAVALDSDSVDNLDTLGTLLAQDGETDEAVTLLNRAARLAPGASGVQFHLAQALAKLGQNDEAIDVLHAMLAGKPRFRERDAAEKLMQQLGG